MIRCSRLLLDGRELLVQEFPAAVQEFVASEFVFIDFFEQRLLRGVILVFHTGLALQHAPGLAAFDGEQHHLAADGEVFELPAYFGFEVNAEVWDVRDVFLLEHVAVGDVLLRDAGEYVVDMNELARAALGDALRCLRNRASVIAQWATV